MLVSNKMQKSVVVAVDRLFHHNTYNRYVKRTSKFMAHGETNECSIGDRVISQNSIPKIPFPKCPPIPIPIPPNPFPNRPSPEQSHLESAASTDEILTAFRALESTLNPNDKKLGHACLKVAQHLESIGFHDRDKTLEFALRALRILDKGSENDDISVAMALYLVGSLTCDSKKFNASLGFLKRADRILTSLGRGDSVDFDTRPVVHAVNLRLANTKTAMGRREEAIVHLKRCSEVEEEVFEPKSKEMRDLAQAFVDNLNFKEALPLCQKALETHKAQLGMNSMEVVHDRRLLGLIYMGFEDYEKALEQYELAHKVWKNWGLGFDVMHAEITSTIQMAMGKYDEGIETLMKVVPQTDEDISHLESAVEGMKESFGPKHFVIGYVYNNLGAAYMEMDRSQEAAQMFAQAKDVMDVALGPHHADTIQICQSLANAHSAMGR